MGVEGAQQDPKLLYYLVIVQKWPTQALLDSGASVNCISTRLWRIRQAGPSPKEYEAYCSIPIRGKPTCEVSQKSK